jgi:hypothetical protein
LSNNNFHDKFQLFLAPTVAGRFFMWIFLRENTDISQLTVGRF